MTTRREVLLALARDHDQDPIVAEVVDGVVWLRKAGAVLPAVGIPLVEATFDHATPVDPPVARCGLADVHEPHRQLIAAATDGSGIHAYGRCPGVAGSGRRR